ncbi:MAG: hypothetical protein PHE89_06055 [Alphaproteobacteria bacterium]|nr:hypothetical protein [Alphaproteobacteria bacterium]
MKNNIIALILLFGLSSCVSAGNSSVSNLNRVEKTLKVEKNLNKEKIKQIYGEPSSEFVKDGLEVYEYKYISVQNSVLGYIPILGIFFDRTYTRNYLYVYFAPLGNVEKFDTIGVEGDFPIG